MRTERICNLIVTIVMKKVLHEVTIHYEDPVTFWLLFSLGRPISKRMPGFLGLPVEKTANIFNGLCLVPRYSFTLPFIL